MSNFWNQNLLGPQFCKTYCIQRTVSFRVVSDGVLFHWPDGVNMGFVGIAGSIGATIVYPIDMGKLLPLFHIF